jgi:hypothetical protein
MNQKKLYGILGGALALSLFGLVYFFGTDMDQPFKDKAETNQVKEPHSRPSLTTVKTRLALVKTIVGDKAEMEQFEVAIANRDHSHEERVALVQTLAEQEPRKTSIKHLLRLLGLLSKPAADKETRQAIVYSLGRFIGFEKARLKLIESLSDKTAKGERIQAMKAIGESSSSWINSHLEPIAQSDPDKEIRELARRTLSLVKKRSVRK